MNDKDMQQDMAQNAMDNAAAERAAAEWDAKTDPLDAFKADGTETIRPRDNVRNPLADCMRVIRLLGQADALGYVGEQAAPIMEEALSLASDILKREVK